MKKISNLGNLCKSSKIVPNHLKWYYFNFFSTFNYLKVSFSPFLGQKLPFFDFLNRFFNSNFQNICSKLIIFLINDSKEIFLSVQNKKKYFTNKKLIFAQSTKILTFGYWQITLLITSLVTCKSNFGHFPLHFSFSLFNKYKKNCERRTKCSCDKCEPVYLIHCKYLLMCSHISDLTPSNPSTFVDLKLIPQICPIAWKKLCQKPKDLALCSKSTLTVNI